MMASFVCLYLFTCIYLCLMIMFCEVETTNHALVKNVDIPTTLLHKKANKMLHVVKMIKSKENDKFT